MILRAASNNRGCTRTRYENETQIHFRSTCSAASGGRLLQCDPRRTGLANAQHCSAAEPIKGSRLSHLSPLSPSPRQASLPRRKRIPVAGHLPRLRRRTTSLPRPPTYETPWRWQPPHRSSPSLIIQLSSHPRRAAAGGFLNSRRPQGLPIVMHISRGGKRGQGARGNTQRYEVSARLHRKCASDHTRSFFTVDAWAILSSSAPRCRHQPLSPSARPSAARSSLERQPFLPRVHAWPEQHLARGSLSLQQQSFGALLYLRQLATAHLTVWEAIYQTQNLRLAQWRGSATRP